MDKKKVIKYVAITYAFAWALQIIGSVFVINHQDMTGKLVFQGCLSVCMFAPLMAALLVKADFRGMGWKPKFKGNIGWLFFCAYIATAVTTAAGAVLFFRLFPTAFDAAGSYTIAQYEAVGQDFNQVLEQAGMTYQTYIIASIPGMLFAPFINTFLAIGEEVGWRGFLYPELNKSMSRVKTWIIGGIIWGVFHFPSMLIAGYEYGTDYLGAPWLGLAAFTLTCIFLGMLEEIVYDRTKCIWFPALLHGSFNAMATIPQLFMNANSPDTAYYMVLGPLPNGLIAGVPMFILAMIMGVWVIRNNGKKVTA